MERFLLVLAVAVVSVVVSIVYGIGCLAVWFMVLGRYGTFEHEYHPLVYWGPVVVGLLMPCFVAWGVNRIWQAERRENERTT